MIWVLISDLVCWNWWLTFLSHFTILHQDTLQLIIWCIKTLHTTDERILNNLDKGFLPLGKVAKTNQLVRVNPSAHALTSGLAAVARSSGLRIKKIIRITFYWLVSSIIKHIRRNMKKNTTSRDNWWVPLQP